MPKDLQTQAKRFASKPETFKLVLGVVLGGIIVLIIFLTSQDDSKHENLYVFSSNWGRAPDHNDATSSGSDEENVGDNNNNNNNIGEHHHESNNNNHNVAHQHHSNNNDNKKAKDGETLPPPPKLNKKKQQHDNDDHHDSSSSSSSNKKKENSNSNERGYIFELDKPRREDEEKFTFKPKSRGGVLKNPNENNPDSLWDDELKKTANELFELFKKYDEDENASSGLPVYGTMCVGKDCGFIPEMIAHLKIPIGHFIVVVNTDDSKWVTFYSELMHVFPGRFSCYDREERLSCAESWNLVVRLGFSIRPMIDQVFIANADWHPVPTPGIENQMARFVEFSKTKLNLVVTRFFHFSSFTYTKKGFLELGYFDEVIYPALAEDVEFHVKAVSKGLGELGMYDRWNDGSKHITRASVGEKKVDERYNRVARFDYILRKWNVRVPAHRDFALSHPFKNPWNNAHIFHNNSWVVDPEHRKCAMTGEGKKMQSGRCYYDAHVLEKIMPPGVELKLADEQFGMHDRFPGPYH